jgi:hypothetical protein
MPIERINPPDVHEPPMYSHAVRVLAASSAYPAGRAVARPS